jgi:hypothetical protein
MYRVNEIYKYYPIPLKDSALSNTSSGVCFSANSKILYVNTSYEIFQINVEDTSESSMINVFSPDTAQRKQIAGYRMMQLAPNDKNLHWQ